MRRRTVDWFQEKEARLQEELNLLAETDPAEYDRRIKQWHKEKMDLWESNDRGAGASAGGEEDRGEDDISANLERRKSLARERRITRHDRNGMVGLVYPYILCRRTPMSFMPLLPACAAHTLRGLDKSLAA